MMKKRIKKKTIKISVIMGVYNPQKSEQLIHAVQSIIHQTFRDWEMLLYDDGSAPQYKEIIEKAASLDKRIILLRGEENRGLAYALNQCIKRARGKYIARMDDDDISKPERLEKMYDFLETHKEYQWAGSNSELIDEQGVWGIDKMREVPQKEDFLLYSPYIHPTVVFRKSVLEKLNGYKVSEETKRCEDYELFMRLCENGYKGYNLQENLLQYREDENAYKKRKYCYRISEMKVRYEGFKRLGILRPDTALYVIKPLLTGLLSPGLMKSIKKSVKKNDYMQNQRRSQAGEI